MSSKSTTSFTLVFVLITLLEISGDMLDIRWLHYGCKPLIGGLLLGYSWWQFRSEPYPAPIRWLMIGMVFAIVGDSCLMIREVDLFAAGLGAFLIMQLCYSRAFWLSGVSLTARRAVWLTAAAFAVYDGIYLTLLRPVFVQNPALTGLWWPVVGYMVCLSLMGTLAIRRGKTPGYGWVAAGALLFILSDSLIAIDKFLTPIAGATWLIMSTYAATQYLIVLGMIRPYKPGRAI